MRLMELEITNIRGIPHVVLKPKGNNFLIWGPNGSGKSAVVDALDFLLTGRIARLTGSGTAGITLAKHGPHIEAKPEKAWARAVVEIPGCSQPVEIMRTLAHPTDLKYPKEAKSSIAPILEVARRGQHVLTRRDILRYITSDGSSRAAQIQELLNLSDVEDIRKAIVRVHNDTSKEVEVASRLVARARGDITSTTGQAIYQDGSTLNVVNECRKALGGEPLKELSSSELKKGLTAAGPISVGDSVNLQMLEQDVKCIVKCEDPKFQATVAALDADLRSAIEQVKSQPKLMSALSQVGLVRMGLDLIDDSGRCPLCDVPWDPVKLREHLQQKLSRADEAKKYADRIRDVSVRFLELTAAVSSSLERVIVTAEKMSTKADVDSLKKWQATLKDLSEDLASALERYSSAGGNEIVRLYAPSNVAEVLGQILSEASEHSPKATPQQMAWDTLTRLEENIKALEEANMREKQAKLWNSRAAILADRFQKARDDVLEGLYDSIRDRFVDLYRKLHGPDEEGFTAKLEPDGAALNLEVDFYGRGTHPPHALHSEGHQDSMGICLYLALEEHLSSGVIDLVILDDVVMSVDAEHRRRLCAVLATELKDKQLLITTHDRTWAGQLRTEGVVKHANSVEFYGWSVETGPRVNREIDLWEQIEKDLDEGNVPGAAAALRRGFEEYLSGVCDALKGRVVFRLDQRYELGDLMHGAMHRYKDLLKKAKKAAESWGNTEQAERLAEIESVANEVFKRINAEQWAVNPNVHYNEWCNFTKPDFIPVRDAFRDLYDLFRCVKCGSLLRVLSSGVDERTVACYCGAVSWNLSVKP